MCNRTQISDTRRGPAHVMDPPLQMYEALLGPASIYTQVLTAKQATPPWPTSSLNPKNRVNSLEYKTPVDWVFFGAEMFELRLLITPAFTIGKQPLRIDVYMSDTIDLDSYLYRALGAKQTALAADQPTASSPFIRHIICALSAWSAARADFEEEYWSMPFGSQILVESLGADIKKANICWIPTYRIEQQWLPTKVLLQDWIRPRDDLPDVIDVGELALVKQPHSSISLVRIPKRYGNSILVFKSAMHEVKYLYHELRLLLGLKPHPNIVPRPILLVTRRTRFGGKRGVCGFVLNFYPLGSLEKVLLPSHPLRHHFDLRCRVRWAHQIASALAHIRLSFVGYYSDLKLHNVVIKDVGNGNFDAMLIDFEQRGAWFSWSPPEVNVIGYLTYLVNARPRLAVPATIVSMYNDLLKANDASWTEHPSTSQPEAIIDGYNHAWTCLSLTDREKAMSFMLGKILWCIFEMQSSINSTLLFASEIFKEVNADLRFGSFRQTPVEMQKLIRACTIGAAEWKNNKPYLVRSGFEVFPMKINVTATTAKATSEQTQEVVRNWWKCELQDAEGHLRDRIGNAETCEILNVARQRLGIEEIVQALLVFEKSLQ
jgi:hypothetical protein